MIVGTRGSRLARIQTDLVIDLLRQRLGADAPSLEVKVLRTEGDRTQNAGTPLQELARGVFVKEIEAALLDGSIDLAVHSLKDMTTTLEPGLALAAVPAREDPRDVLVSRDGLLLAALAPGARVGTSSPRRARQLSLLRPDLRFESIRGNVDTRVRKVEEGEYDAAVLAAAGLRRLGFEERIAEYFEPDDCLPDPGQGALALEVRADDEGLRSMLARLNDPATWAAVTAERSLLRELGGGCKVPIGALGVVVGDEIMLRGLVASPDSAAFIRASARGPVGDPDALGVALAAELRDRGAGSLLGTP